LRTTFEQLFVAECRNDGVVDQHDLRPEHAPRRFLHRRMRRDPRERRLAVNLVVHDEPRRAGRLGDGRDCWVVPKPVPRGQRIVQFRTGEKRREHARFFFVDSVECSI
jgi:hypothetical protein